MRHLDKVEQEALNPAKRGARIPRRPSSKFAGQQVPVT